jgi:putative ABC transport system permease protein
MNKVKSALLLFQYCSAIVLVVCSITIHRQLNLIESKDLGFRNKNVLVVYTPPVSEDGSDQKLEALKTKMLPFTAFANVTLSSDVPGKIVGFGMGNSLSSDPTKPPGCARW